MFMLRNGQREDQNYLVSKLLILYLFRFRAGCRLGYLVEVLFRRFFSAKKWVNPGFLKGPWLPLYGFGIVTMFTFCFILYRFLPDSLPLFLPVEGRYGKSYTHGASINDLLPICIRGTSLVLLEFIAGLIFVKGFKVRLWDYTNQKGNVRGIICPLFSIIWFIIAIIYYYVLNPFVYEFASKAFVYLFGSGNAQNAAHFGSIFILGLTYGVFAIDVIVSENLFAKISKATKQSHFAQQYEKIRENQKEAAKVNRKRFYDALPEKLKEGLGKKSRLEPAKKLSMALRKILLKDPQKLAEDNYQADGRPKKEDDGKESAGQEQE